MPDVPPVEECFSVAEHRDLAPPGVQVPGLSLRVDTRLDLATAGWAFGQPSGEPVLRAWMRFADGREPDPLALLTFADALPPTSFAMGNLGWAPTVQLQVLVRALPAPGWCLVEARSSEIAGGWVDEDYRIWDSTGRLVAQSRQLARAPLTGAQQASATSRSSPASSSSSTSASPLAALPTSGPGPWCSSASSWSRCASPSSPRRYPVAGSALQLGQTAGLRDDLVDGRLDDADRLDRHRRRP